MLNMFDLLQKYLLEKGNNIRGVLSTYLNFDENCIAGIMDKEGIPTSYRISILDFIRWMFYGRNVVNKQSFKEIPPPYPIAPKGRIIKEGGVPPKPKHKH